jgi:hypothetical protein
MVRVFASIETFDGLFGVEEIDLAVVPQVGDKINLRGRTFRVRRVELRPIQPIQPVATISLIEDV